MLFLVQEVGDELDVAGRVLGVREEWARHDVSRAEFRFPPFLLGTPPEENSRW
jgi:hypothetical protein